MFYLTQPLRKIELYWYLIKTDVSCQSVFISNLRVWNEWRMFGWISASLMGSVFSSNALSLLLLLPCPFIALGFFPLPVSLLLWQHRYCIRPTVVSICSRHSAEVLNSFPGVASLLYTLLRVDLVALLCDLQQNHIVMIWSFEVKVCWNKNSWWRDTANFTKCQFHVHISEQQSAQCCDIDFNLIPKPSQSHSFSPAKMLNPYLC